MVAAPAAAGVVVVIAAATAGAHAVGKGGTSFDSGSDQHFSVAAQPGNGSVAITFLASAPVISGTQADQATTDSRSISPFSKVTITDANPGNPTETVAVSSESDRRGQWRAFRPERAG